MTWRLLERDPDGTEEWFRVDPVTGKWIIKTHDPDISVVPSANRRLQNDGTGGWSKSRDIRHLARIPNWVAHKWLSELHVNVYDQNDAPKVRKLLNDPDWRWLKTVDGRV